MPTYQFERELRVERPLDSVFDFFSNPYNLEAITPSFLRFRIVKCPPLPLQEGSLIHYRLRLRGLPLGWTTLISRWEPPYVFVDEQLKGPYRQWVHTHRFESDGIGGTIVRDHVAYDVVGGTLVDRLFVRKDVGRIFDYRSERLRELLDGAATPGVRSGSP